MKALSNKIVYFLMSISCVSQISLSLQSPVLSIYLLEITGDLRHIGAVIGIYLFTSALFSTLISNFFLKYRYKLLFVSYSLFFAYCLLMYSFPSTVEVYFLQALAGLATAFGWSGFVELFVHTVGKDNYTRYSSFNNLLGKAIGSLAAAASGFSAHYFGLKNVFLIMATMSLLSLTISIISSTIDKKPQLQP